MKDIVNWLILNKKSISVMESCTGGCISSAITDVDNSSSIYKFGAITYSNEFKIKMGVDERVIEKYSVYSMECAKQMSKKISDYTSSDYGIGVTGKFNKKDPNNLFGDDSSIFISIYSRSNDRNYNKVITARSGSRHENKEYVLNEIVLLFNEKIIKK